MKKKQEGGFFRAFLAYLHASIAQPSTSLVVNGISGIGVRRAGRGYMNGSF